MLRKLTTLCSPLACVSEKQLELSQRSVLGMGRTKYDSQGTQHTICEHNQKKCCLTHKCVPVFSCRPGQFRSGGEGYGFQELCCTADSQWQGHFLFPAYLTALWGLLLMFPLPPPPFPLFLLSGAVQWKWCSVWCDWQGCAQGRVEGVGVAGQECEGGVLLLRQHRHLLPRHLRQGRGLQRRLGQRSRRTRQDRVRGHFLYI